MSRLKLCFVGVIGYALASWLCLAQVAHEQPRPIDWSNHVGWTSLFDGQTLAGWEGDSAVWHVEDGAIVGQLDAPPGRPFAQTFLALKDRQPADFELTMDFKLEGSHADSGVQFRSYHTTPTPNAARPQDVQWYVGGYQFDLDFVNIYNGQVAEGSSLGRGIIASRGQLVHTQAGSPPELTAELGTAEGLGGYFKINDWNHMLLIARGHVLIQIINGHVMAALVDDDRQFKANGLVALQCAGRGPVKISFKNIWLKEFRD